jgi:acetoacetyl-CoA synthetase
MQYTVNGKKIEVAVKNIVCGRAVRASNTVANPESFAWFQEWMKAGH